MWSFCAIKEDFFSLVVEFSYLFHFPFYLSSSFVLLLFISLPSTSSLCDTTFLKQPSVTDCCHICDVRRTAPGRLQRCWWLMTRQLSLHAGRGQQRCFFSRDIYLDARWRCVEWSSSSTHSSTRHSTEASVASSTLWPVFLRETEHQYVAGREALWPLGSVINLWLQCPSTCWLSCPGSPDYSKVPLNRPRILLSLVFW